MQLHKLLIVGFIFFFYRRFAPPFLCFLFCFCFHDDDPRQFHGYFSTYPTYAPQKRIHVIRMGLFTKTRPK